VDNKNNTRYKRKKYQMKEWQHMKRELLKREGYSISYRPVAVKAHMNQFGMYE
jgi:hypothetical protein